MKYSVLVLLSLLFLSCSDEVKEKEQKIIDSNSVTKELSKDLNIKTYKEKPKPVAKAKQEVQEEPTPKKVKEKKIKIEYATDKSGEELYVACLSCHGKNAEKSALNKSLVIQGWNAKKIEIALKGYQDETYGRTMKSIMQAQAKKLSDAQIKALSKYISEL